MKKLSYKVRAAGLSDIGLVRQVNQDMWAEIPEFGLYILADGMGGHLAGEVAAMEAVNTFCEAMRLYFAESEGEKSLENVRQEIEATITRVNLHVYKMGLAKREYRGMGTTFCCLYFHNQGLIHAHVGDSRIYRLRHHTLSQLTKDHSLLSELLDIGELNESQSQEFLYKHIITKAVGTEEVIEPSVQISDVEERDLYLICSDGLSDLVTSNIIESILVSTSSIENAALALVDAAKEKGGHDNITVVVIAIGEEADHGSHLSG